MIQINYYNNVHTIKNIYQILARTSFICRQQVFGCLLCLSIASKSVGQINTEFQALSMHAGIAGYIFLIGTAIRLGYMAS